MATVIEAVLRGAVGSGGACSILSLGPLERRS